MTGASLCVVGLPESGKTTYLAALWEVISHPDSRRTFGLQRMPVNRKYLISIHRRWLRGEEAIKTKDDESFRGKSPEVQRVTLALYSSSGEPFDLQVPDLAGEAFNEAWEMRRWPRVLQKAAESADALLVFVNPQMVVFPTSIAYLNQMIATESEGSGDSDSEASIHQTKWDPASSPTDVKLTDVTGRMFTGREIEALPVAVVVSAWDKISPSELEPELWLKVNLPMFYQFLVTNPETFPSRCFGVSAQGGDFKSETDLAELRKRDPVKRPFIRSDGETSNDLTLPIKWILERR
jgi:hypothetical protein